MAITPLPSPPLTTDNPVVFNTKAFAWVASLGTFTTEANALAVDVSDDAIAADTAKTNAEAAAAAAVAAANATKWVSGTTYTEGAVVWSPITFLSYRRKSTGGGTTDPSLDTTNWAQVAGTGDVTADGVQTLTNKTIAFADNTLTDVAGTTATQTLTNKTLTSPELTTAPYVNGSYRANIVAVSALDIDCSAGNYFTKTISANSTFTVSNVPASRSYSFTLELTHTSGTVTWFAGVEWPGGTAPTLTNGKTSLFMFVTDDGGTRWRGAALVDYTT
jgi:hypothetical protein